VDLELAAVARACVDVADRKGAAEAPQHLVAEPAGKLAQRGVGCRRRLAEDAGAGDLQKDLSHRYRSAPA
jgi:hypothetical protein